MADTVLIRLGGDVDDVRHALTELGAAGDVEVLRLSDLSSNAWSLARGFPRCSRLGLLGSPPEDGIGYGFVPLLAVGSRPRHVSLIDAKRDVTVTQSLPQYLSHSLPVGIAQITSSSVAVIAQRLLATCLSPLPPTTERSANDGPSRVTYLRPTAGAPTVAGGPITHTHEVIRALRQRGAIVGCFTTDELIASTAAADPDPPCEWRVVRVPRLFRGVPPSVAFAGDLALAHAALPHARQSDFIYQRHNRFALAGVLLSKLTKLPLFLEYNSPSDLFHRSVTPFSRQRTLSEEVSLTVATRVIVVSEVARSLLLDRGVEDHRIIVNPNGVHAPAFARGDGRIVRKRLGLDPEAFVIGFVGSFFAFHGTRMLAEAFVKLAKTEPAARLLLIGDGDERGPTEQLLVGAGPADRFASIGFLLPTEVPAHLDACDVLASPHVPLPGGMAFFGSPTKLFEYMAAGKAIVASRLGQIGEVLEHERSALLVEPGSPDAIVRAIVRLMKDVDLRKRLGSQARDDAIRHHSWERNAERLIDAYQSLPIANSGSTRTQSRRYNDPF
jgi:glycosyltransferase involved in cell wall biosynthesis